MRERALVLFFCLSIAWGNTPAAAQSCVVIAADVEGSPGVTPAQIDPLVAALSADGSLGSVLSPSALAPIAIERLSREVVAVSDDDVHALADAVHELETMVAMRQRDAAVRQAQRVEDLSRGARDGVATQPTLATTMLSGCLADAWLRLQSGQEADARARLLTCRAAHPEVAVDAHTTAPPVHRLLVDVDARLAARANHRVTITGAPDGCEIVLDGRVAGTTPGAIESVAEGDHEVRLRCSGLDHGRVHAMSVAGEDRTFAIDPSFDQALRTTDGARLVLADAASAQAHRVEYGLRLAAIAGASEVILVTATAAGVRADRVTLGRGVIASASYVSAEDTPRVARALAGDASTAMGEAETEDHHETSASSVDVAPIVGGIAGAAGVVLLGVGWGYYGEWSRVSTLGDAFDGQRAYYSQLVLGLGLGGAGLAAISVPFWLPPEHDVPWWSWLVGGAGVALMGTGIALVAVDAKNDALMGEMFMASSAMFLAVPTTHLFRLAFGPLAPAVSVDASSTHASVLLRGSF